MRAYGSVHIPVVVESTAVAPTPHIADVKSRSGYLVFPALGTAILGVMALIANLTPSAKPVGRDLWNELSDPAKLLEYVAAHHASDNASASGSDALMDDDLFYPLSCALYDDDTVYPNDVCENGDNSTCHSSTMTEAYMATCGSACDEGWGVPCGWEAIADLPQLCDGSFTTTFPNKSSNEMPDHMAMKTLTVNSTGRSFWACNVHAFCYSCVGDTGLVNDFCKAAVIRTKSLYAPAAVFEFLSSYWCDSEIITEIQNGTFCGYAADKMDYCEKYGEFARL